MRSIALMCILIALFENVECADKILGLDLPVFIGIAAGGLALVLLLIILTMFCFRCGCFAKSKEQRQTAAPSRSQTPQHKEMQQRSMEPAWDHQPQQRIPPQNNPSSLESQPRPLNPPPTQLQRQGSVLSDLRPLSPQSDNYTPQSKLYNSESPDSLQSYPMPQYPPPKLPSSLKPSESFSNPQSPQNYPSMYPDRSYGQQYYAQEYPIDFYDEQYQQNAPMTTRIQPGFRYPDGLIDELKTDGSPRKLKPPPPPKPIKLIKINEAPAAEYGKDRYDDPPEPDYNPMEDFPMPDYGKDEQPPTAVAAPNKSTESQSVPAPDY